MLSTRRYDPKQVSRLLHEVRQKCEHQISTSGNTKGKYLDPIFAATKPSRTPGTGKRTLSVQFLCIPYFLLQHLPSLDTSTSSEMHLLRTLLQTQYPSTSGKRELQQVVCQLDRAGRRQGFYVPQLWCLIIDNGEIVHSLYIISYAAELIRHTELLITSGPLSKDEARLYITDPGISSDDQTPPESSNFLHVSDADGRCWLLPLSECQSWTVG